MSHKIKILHCLETVGSGGVEQRRLSLAKYLDSAIYEQAIVCSKIKDSLKEKFASQGIVVFVIGELKHPFNLAYFRRLLKVVREFKPDIIHGAVFEGVISAVVGGVFSAVKAIVIEETSEPANRSWRGHFFLKILSKFSNKVIATSPAVYQYLVEKIGIQKDKAVLVLNGVEPLPEPEAAETTRVKTELKLADQDFIIGTAGRLLDDHKRFSDAIQALALLQKDIPQARLLIVGGGKDHDALVSLAASLAITDKVIFVGHQTDLRPFYSAMDIFLLPSQREGFGMVVVEAMFMGLPVIASDVGGLPSIVQNGETGFLVKPLNPAEISEKIKSLYANKPLRTRMGEAGKARAYKVFHAQRYVQDVEAVYKEVLSV